MENTTIIDLFAGGGGASKGMVMALGTGPTVAINHDPEAIRMHAINHPSTLHLCDDILKVEPFRPGNRPVDLVWGSPDCRHYSRAKGGKPLDRRIRSLPWQVHRWVKGVKPRYFVVENVEEMKDWGPLDENDKPIKARKGELYDAWIEALRDEGYLIESRVLKGCDYGAPTTRKRLFVIGVRDGESVPWPQPTHGPGKLPHLGAWTCIDFNLPMKSIFGRRRPLSDNTMTRIAAGLDRYVLNTDDPFLLGYDDTGKLVPVGPDDTGKLVPVGPDEDPAMVAGGQKHRLVAAWIAKHYTGVVGHDLLRPLGTVTQIDHHGLVSATLENKGPKTLQRAGNVAAFLIKYYGTGRAASLFDPLDTITTKDRFGLVTVHLAGHPYVINDIETRMLQPRELANAQGFPKDYRLIGTKRSQTAKIGNSVCPPLAKAIVEALFYASTPIMTRRAA